MLALRAWAADSQAQFDVRDAAEFSKLFAKDARLVTVSSEFQFTEGPVWTSRDGGYLVFSNIPASRILKWSPDGGLSTFRSPSNNTNGNTRDPQGRLVSCEHSARRVTRTEKDGTVAVLADRYQGKRLNSPNDVVVTDGGRVYFTDPPYGIPKDQKQELEKSYVFRLDPESHELKAVAEDLDRPNGLAFSPDEKRLYVADSGKPHHVRVYDVGPDGGLSNGHLFCTIDKGNPDGIRVDEDGRLWSSAADGVQVFAADGHLIGKLLTPSLPNPKDASKSLPQSPANLAFGGPEYRTLFITGRNSLFRIETLVRGAVRR
jgi:gluconolactonase